MRAHLEFNSGLTIIQLWDVVCGMIGGESDLSVYATQLNLANCTIDTTVPSPYVAYPSGDELNYGNFGAKCYALETPTAEGYYRHIYPSWQDAASAFMFFGVNMHSSLGLAQNTSGHYAGGTNTAVISEFGGSKTTTNPNAFYLDFIIDVNGDILITGDFKSTTVASIPTSYMYFLCEHNNEVSVQPNVLDKGCFTFDSYTIGRVLGTFDYSCSCVTEGRSYKFGSRGAVSTQTSTIKRGTSGKGLLIEDRFLTVDKGVALYKDHSPISYYAMGYGHALFPSWLKFTFGDNTITEGSTVLIGSDVYDVRSLYAYSTETGLTAEGYFLVKQGVY